MSPLGAQERILILAARLDLGHRDAEELKTLLDAGPPWKELLQSARQLGVEALLRRHLLDPRLGGPAPAEVLAALDQAYQLASIKSLQMHGALEKVLAALAAAGIQAILLKGAHLARDLYGDTALRPMSDLDLLVRPGDRQAAWDTLTAMGFHPATEAPYNSALDQAISERTGHLPALYLDPVCRVEIHLYILSGELAGGDTMGPLWATRVASPQEGAPAWLLSPEYEVIYLCSHLHRHLATGDAAALYWFCDIHETLRRATATLDWQALARLAAARGERPALEDILGLLARHWATPVPASLCQGTGMTMEAFFAAARAGLEARQAFSALAWARQRLGAVRHAPGLAGKASYLLALVFPSRPRMVAKYGARGNVAMLPWYFLHPFIQAGNLARSLGSHVRRRLRP